MLSFWERESFVEYDYVVVGGGIVGLSTAIELKERAPEASVIVLERGVFPSGASTKNAGFACFGSLTEILADLDQMSQEEVVGLVSLRWEGLQKLRARLGDEQIGFRNYGGYELLTENQLPVLDELDRVNALLQPLFGQHVYEHRPELISEFGFDQNHVKGLIFNPLEAQIHTGQMMKSLQKKAVALRVEICTGTEVDGIHEEGDGVRVSVRQMGHFVAKRVAVCTNAFTKKFFPDLKLEPGRGVVLVTQPIPNLPFRGTFHYEEGYYYFRNIGDRVIFGGGRNLDIEGETTTEFAIPEQILDRLKDDLQRVILPKTQCEIDQVWSGIMAFGNNKQPIIKQSSVNVFLGVRLGGMGVAIGTQMGAQLAKLMQA